MFSRRSRGILLALTTIIGGLSMSAGPAAAQEEVLARRDRSPFIAGAIATHVPAGGHLYAGEPERAAIVAVVFLAGGVLISSAWNAADNCRAPDCDPAVAERRNRLGGRIALSAYLFSLMDAPLAARRQNRARAAAPLSGTQAGFFVAPDGGSGVRITMPVGR
jgi:hypothetical protein